MKKSKFLFSLLMLLTFSLGTMWANVGNLYYTLQFVNTSGKSAYATDYDYTSNGMDWSVPGNMTLGDYDRIGGKGITAVDRLVTGKEAMGDAIAQIIINHNGRSRNDLVVNSITVTTASDASFTEDVETVTVTPTIGKQVAGSVTIEPDGDYWPLGNYYQIAFNVTNTSTSNGGLDVTSIEFYSYQSASAAAINADNIDLGIEPTMSFPYEKEVALTVTGANLSDPITYTVMGAHLSASGTLTTAGGTLTVTITSYMEEDIDETIVLSSGSVTTNVSVKANVIETSGDGTQTHPFSIADVVKINSGLGMDKYWVKGYILGCAKNGGLLDETITNSNFALGDSPSQTSDCVPVELPTADGIRAALNLVDHPTYQGQQVKVYGQLVSYFSFKGVKAVSDYELILAPIITPSVSSIDFGDVKEDTETPGEGYVVQTSFNLVGAYLTDQVELEITSGEFKITDPSKSSGYVTSLTITPQAGVIDTTITVQIYTRQTGVFNGTLSITSAASTPDFAQIDIPLTINLLETYEVVVSVYDADRCTVSANGQSSGSTGTVSVFVASATEVINISCTPKLGWQFDSWSATTGITIADDASATTTATASQEGTITAMCTYSCSALKWPYYPEADNITYNSATLKWNWVWVGENRASQYKVMVTEHETGTVVIPATIVNYNGTDSQVTFEATGLKSNTQYDFLAWAITDEAGYCPEGETNGTSFTTLEAPAATLTLSEAGNDHSFGSGLKLGDVVTLPTTAAECTAGKTLVGWSASTVAETNTKPTMYEPGAEYTIATTTEKLYAVYALVSSNPLVEHALGSATLGGTNGNTASTGYTFTRSTKGSDKEGYIQDAGNVGDEIYMQIATNSQIISEQPSAIIVEATLGAGSVKDPLGNNVYAVLVDGDGANVGDPVVLTTKITNKNGSAFSANLPTANYANVRGVKISHLKEDSWNVRYYAMSFKYTTGGTSTATGYSTSCPSADPASISVDKTSIDLGTIYYENGTRTATFTLTGENLTKTLYINSDKHPIITVSPTSVTPEADGTVNAEITVTGSSSWLGEKVAKISIVNDGEDPEIFEQNLITVTLNVIEKNEPELSYAQAKDTAYTVGQPYSLQTLINPHSLTGITYSSSSASIATIDASTGVITPANINGTTTITATFAGNGDYKAGSASYVLHVYRPMTLTCSGALETEEYELGDEISPAGLIATVSYDDGTTWNPSDATFTFSQSPIVQGQETVSAWAEWNGLTSYALNGLVAKMKWHKVTVADGIANGSVVVKDGSYTVTPTDEYPKGKELKIIATPASASYVLDKILVNGVEQSGVVNNELTFVIPAGDNFEVSATFKHTKLAAGLAWSVTEKTMPYGTNYERFAFPLMTNPNEIPWDDITLSSSDPTVAEFGTPTHEGSSWTAGVIMHKAGTAVMTASFAGNDDYEAAEVSYTLTIEKADLAASDFYWFQYPDISQVESDTYTFYEYSHSYAYVVTSKINKNTEVHYESSVPAVASVSTSGNPFALRAGTTTIKAIFDGNDQYNAKTIQYTFIVQKASPVITWSGNFTGNSYTFTYGVTDEIPHFGSVTPSGVREDVHFSSSNPAVATIGDEDGYVYYQKQGGTTTIRAYIEESDLVNAAEISYDLTVVPLVELVLEGAGKMTMASQDAQYKDYATTVSLTEDTHYFSIKVNGNTFQKGVTLSRSNASAKIDGYYGTTTSLTADVAGDYTFTWNNKDSVITVTFPNEKLPAELGWNFTEATAYTVGKSYTLPTLLNPHVLMVELSSSNTDVADFEEGQLVLKAAGVTTITATSVETVDFAQGTASYTLNVAAPASLAISGELVKTEYEPEEFIDRTGLVATATYTNGSTLNVTDLATWTIDGNAETQIYNMEDQYSFAAAWEGLSASKVLVVRLKKHAVTFEQPANGTLVITNQGEPIQSGDEFISGVTLVITATPNPGYKLDVLTVNGADMISLGSNEFSIDGEAVTVVAAFVEDTGTGVDNAEAGEKVQKVMIDNHIYIIRGGKTYTAEGQLVR